MKEGRQKNWNSVDGTAAVKTFRTTSDSEIGFQLEQYASYPHPILSITSSDTRGGGEVAIDENTAEEVKPLYLEVFKFFEELARNIINKGIKQ